MKKIGVVPPILLYILVSLPILTEAACSTILPIIADSLKSTGGLLQFSTTLYYSGFALGILLFGRISDLYGRKIIIILGFFIYIIANILLSRADNIELFLSLRFIQGLGASVGSSMAHAMSRDSYKGYELSYIYANTTIVVALMSAVGSVLAGEVLEYFKNWQYLFTLFTVYGSVILLLFLKFLPETNAYIGVQNHQNLVDIAKIILKDYKLLGIASIVGMYHGICFGFLIQAPFIFIGRLSIDVDDYAKLFCFLGISNIFGAFITKKLVKKYINPQQIRVIGFLLSITACCLLLIFAYFYKNSDDLLVNIIAIFVPIIIHFIGHSMVMSTTMSVALIDYNKVNGIAGSVFGFLYYMMSACVTSLISAFHSNKIDNFAYIFVFLLFLCLIIFYYSNKKELSIIFIDKNLPNYLTIFRLLSIPFIVCLLYFYESAMAKRIACIVFMIAVATDFFDGFLARKFNVVSSFGRMFDPIADKVLVGCVLMMLVRSGEAEVLPSLLIMAREFTVAGLREFLAQLHVSVPVSMLAKIKTAMQMFALTLLIVGNQGSGIDNLNEIGNYCLWLSAILTIMTGFSYLNAAKKYF